MNTRAPVYVVADTDLCPQAWCIPALGAFCASVSHVHVSNPRPSPVLPKDVSPSQLTVDASRPGIPSHPIVPRHVVWPRFSNLLAGGGRIVGEEAEIGLVEARDDLLFDQILYLIDSGLAHERDVGIVG